MSVCVCECACVNEGDLLWLLRGSRGRKGRRRGRSRGRSRGRGRRGNGN